MVVTAVFRDFVYFSSASSRCLYVGGYGDRGGNRSSDCLPISLGTRPRPKEQLLRLYREGICLWGGEQSGCGCSAGERQSHSYKQTDTEFLIMGIFRYSEEMATIANTQWRNWCATLRSIWSTKERHRFNDLSSLACCLAKWRKLEESNNSLKIFSSWYLEWSELIYW